MAKSFILLALAAVLAAATRVPTPTAVVECTPCEALIAALASPDGKKVVFGGDAGFGLFDLEKANFTWTNDFTDYQSEQEGPFAWSSNDFFAGMAPDGSTTETMWGIDAASGNNTWTLSDDGSMSGVTITSTPGAFYSGDVTFSSLVKVDAKTGKQLWKHDFPGSYINSLASAPRHPNVSRAESMMMVQAGNASAWIVGIGYDAVVAAYDADSGAKLWAVENLPTQSQLVAVDHKSQMLFVVGAVDQDGNALTYTSVFAYNLTTGAPVWQSNVTVPTANVNIQVFRRWVLLSTASSVVAVDAVTGKQLWVLPAYTPSTNPVPIASAGDWNGTAVLYASVKGTDLTCFPIDQLVLPSADAAPAPLWSTTLPNDMVASLPPLQLNTSLIVAVASSDSTSGFVATFTTE